MFNVKWSGALGSGVCALVLFLIPPSHISYHAISKVTTTGFFPEAALVPTKFSDIPQQVPISSVYPIFEFDNETHKLHSTLGKDGWHIEPAHSGAFPLWSFNFSPVQLGRTEMKPLGVPLSTDITIKDDSLVTITRPELVEWYKSTEKGIEQGFTIAKRPGGRAPLTLTGAIDTSLEPRESTENHITFSYEGKDVLRLDSFVAYDAYYTPLPLTFAYDETSHLLTITVDDTDATYPIVIDPLASTPIWTVESDLANAQMGFGVLSADVNGDGIDDMITGAPTYTNGEVGEGAIMLYYGSDSGPSTTPNQIIESNLANSEFGSMLAMAGDVNSDGYEDIMVGAPYYANGETDEGAVFFYYGSASGLSTTSVDIIESNIAFENIGTDDGNALTSIGDVNNDSYDDVLIGDIIWYNGVDYVGRVAVYAGSATGIATTTLLASIEGTDPGADFGNAAAPVGDVNSDGYDDFIVSDSNYSAASGTGRIRLYYGGASGPDTTADWSVEAVENEQMGWTLDTGDFNGDGYIDIIAGAGNEDEIEAFYGSISGFPSEPDWQHYDNKISDNNTGWFDVGDANNDGYDDILVGSGDYYNESFGAPGFGSAFLYQGSPNGLSGVAAWNDKPVGDPSSSGFGASVSLGDVNDDGFDDAIIGAPFYDNGETDEGRLYIYYGNSSILYGTGNTDVYNPKPHQIIVGPPPGSFSFSESMASGDFNGDGHQDIISGTGNDNDAFGGGGIAYGYYGLVDGSFPSTPDVAMSPGDGFSGYFAGSGRLAAGDINNDGYDDVIAVDSSYHAGTFTSNGGVFLFYGSVSGLPAVPDWSHVGSTSARVGEAVAAVDVNGDDYKDIIVSTSGFPSYYVILAFHGSATGPSTTPDWSYDVATDQGVETLASAGDVNNDGYEDVIAAAPYYTNGESQEGRLLLFYGSTTGLGVTPDWSFEPNIAGVNLGSKYSGQGWGGPMGSAGDFNNDGYSDFAVGAMAYLYDPLSWGDGAVYVFYGSATGPGASEDVLLTQAATGPYQLFGNGVTAVGDTNGDGYDDLVVGAPEMDEGIALNSYGGGQLYEGRAYMYYGSATGLGANANWAAETNTSETWMGQSVLSLGDVNGDGYADFAGGSVWRIPYTSGGDQGAIFIYRGQGYFNRTESGGSTDVTEGGATDTFTVVLQTQPTSDVVFDIVSQDPGAATVSSSTLTFTNSNWDTPQTITVTPVSDGDIDDERVPIRISVNRAASNDAFDDVPTQHVLALVTDDGLGGGTVAPTVTVSAATSISSTTATLNGTITATGGENASVRGFHYGLTGAYGSTTSGSGSFGVGAFSLPVTGLTCATTYHFEAYATNSAGIGDSADLTFITSACPSGPTSTPTSTPSSGGGSTGGSKITTPTTTPTSTPVVAPQAPPSYVLPPIQNQANPSSWRPAPGASVGSVDRSELTIPPQLEQTPEVKPPANPSREIVQEKIVRKTLPQPESAWKRVLGASIEKIRQVSNAVRENIWGQILIALGLVSLIIRPLVTSLRVQSLNDAWLVVRRLFSMLAPRKRRIVEPWGTVYDGRTKRPLDPAYVSLVSIDSGEEVLGAVTDIEGRYGFLPPPGRYRVMPSKTHYTFPSDDLFKKHNDYVYDNLYFGETFDVVDSTTVVRRNIPMDAQGRDWNEEEKVRMGFSNKRKRRQIWISILNTLFLAGAAYTLYVLFVSPNIWNWVMGTAYAVIWTAEMLWKRHFHLTTVVRNANGDPVPFAVIKVFHPDQDIVVKKVVADVSGKFYFLIAPGRYTVVVEIKDGEGNYQPVLTLRNQNLKRGILLKDIVLGL